LSYADITPWYWNKASEMDCDNCAGRAANAQLLNRALRFFSDKGMM